MSNYKPGSYAEYMAQKSQERWDGTGETPNPTPEQREEDRKFLKEMMHAITPTNCPYFQATFIEIGQNEKTGVKIAYLDLLEIFYEFAFRFGKQDNPERVDRPDRLNICTAKAGEISNVEFVSTHFFVTQDGKLCCLREHKKTANTGDNLAEKEEVPGPDVWLFLEDKNPNAQPMSLGEKLFVPYQIVCDAVKTRNENWGVQPPAELREIILGKWQNLEAQQPRQAIARNSALARTLCFTGDNIHRAVVTSLARVGQWEDGPEYFKGLQQEYNNLKITVLLPNGDKAASLWEFLQRGGPAMVKAHYALWARYYEQVPDGLALQDVIVNINDFCRDLGYAKHKGAYKAEQKRQAMRLLNALTSTEMAATYQVPSQQKGQTKTRRLKGTIWRRGLEAEERDTYEDSLGSARAGNPEEWIPAGFSFSPGAWHADRDWRRYNKYVGKIGAGLMQLRVDRDEWAILIGGYLGTLVRTGQYRNRRLKIGTILENTGLDKAIGHRQSQFREKFYRALDRLVEEKIIVTYKTEGFDDSDVDPDDLTALAEYGINDPFPKGDWRSHVVEFAFDFSDDMRRLEVRKKKAIAAKTKPKKAITA